MLKTIMASILVFNYISAPSVGMREQPSIDSEIVSQALFGESITLQDETEEWVKIKTNHDQYEGWVMKDKIHQRLDEYLSPDSVNVAKVNRLAAHVYHVKDTAYGPLLTLPFGTILKVVGDFQDPQSRWVNVMLLDDRQVYVQRGDITINPPAAISCESMCLLSQSFLGLPYTWGGRSSFGFDCSGFTQMLYRQMGIALPRDSKDQFRWDGFAKINEEDLKSGDLIFWGYTVDKIRHVGLYLGEGRFIHATAQENQPYLRISQLSEPFWNGKGLYPYKEFRSLKKQTQ